MSDRALFFASLDELYHCRQGDALQFLLEESTALAQDIQSRLQTSAPFWSAFLRADGAIVQACRNLAGYLGWRRRDLVGRSLWPLLGGGGQNQVTTVPSHHGGQLGIVCCPLPWMGEMLGDLLALVWPLSGHDDEFSFAFRSFEGLQALVVLSAQGQRLSGFNPSDYHCRRCELVREAVWSGRTSTWMQYTAQGQQYEMFQVPFFRGGMVQLLVLLGRDVQGERVPGRAFSFMRATE